MLTQGGESEGTVREGGGDGDGEGSELPQVRGGEVGGKEPGYGVLGRGGEGVGGAEKRIWGKRNALESGSEEDGEEGVKIPVSKKIKTERKTAGHAIAQALDRLGGTARDIQQTKTERAVEKLQTEYSSTLSLEEQVKACMVMENEVKASIFVTLKAGEVRDRWLQEAISKI